MKKRPEQPDQQEIPEIITSDEFNSRIDELLDQIFLEEVEKTTLGEVEKTTNGNRQAIKTSNGEWIH